jgi:hypothetical protein
MTYPLLAVCVSFYVCPSVCVSPLILSGYGACEITLFSVSLCIFPNFCYEAHEVFLLHVRSTLIF